MAASLHEWFERQRRDLPWRRTRDPYAIWVSEIMLQQTRVETVIGYYARFLDAFPTVEALARAPQDQVLKLWEGLGYYARARNLQAAARVVVERGGEMPATRDGLLDLPGIGRYTAGAIASIAYGERVAAVDGNVERVLSRLHAMARGSVWDRAEALVAQALDPSVHNQALMELGATVCTPRAPRCDGCPVREGCAGLASGDPTAFPERTRAKLVPQRDVCSLLLWQEGRFLIVRRPPDGLLGGLWDLPWAFREGREQLARTCARAAERWVGGRADVGDRVAQVKHVFTHFQMHLHAYEGHAHGGDGLWIAPHERHQHAFPNATRRVFDIVFEGAPEKRRREKGGAAHG